MSNSINEKKGQLIEATIQATSNSINEKKGSEATKKRDTLFRKAIVNSYNYIKSTKKKSQ